MFSEKRRALENEVTTFEEHVCLLNLSERGMGSLKCDHSNAAYVHGKARDKARLRTAIEGALKVRACNMLLKHVSFESHNFKWFRLVFDRFGPQGSHGRDSG